MRPNALENSLLSHSGQASRTLSALIRGLIIPFLILLVTLCPQRTNAQDTVPIRELASSIENVLETTGAPAAGIALVNREGPVWIAGLGRSDVSSNMPADENTMFRIASVSKIFVALAILKLKEEGKLKLDDRVRDLVPEIEFQNQWEETHPVRVVHLLEHTTGWDEIHLIEIANNDPTPGTLKEALDFHPHSRKSLWPPGSRTAYSNSGYAVAAFIVEKLSGVSYETYTREHFFLPLQMTNTTFFNDEKYQKLGAMTYNKQHQPVEYRHILYRPTGAINSSPKELANLLRMLLNNGAFDTLRLLSEQSILRMEIPQSTPGAKAGLQLGHGLGNVTSIHNGFVYNGHNGSLDGGLAEVAFLRDHGIGHVILLNETNPTALYRISTLIRDFETRSIQKDSFSAGTNTTQDFTFSSGYYIPINPRNQGSLFLDYLFGPEKIYATNDAVYKSPIFFGGSEKFIPVTDSTFRTATTHKIGMVRTMDPLAGEVLYFDRLVMKRIPAFVIFGQLTVAGAWIISITCGILLWTILAILALTKPKNKAFLLTTYPVLTSIMFVLLIILFKVGYTETDVYLARPGSLSIGILLLSILIPLNTLWSLVAIYLARNQPIKKTIFGFTAVFASLHLLVTVYLIAFNFFPAITWA